MIEFIKRINGSEKKSGYLNLTDIEGIRYGHRFPPALTALWIITDERKYQASRNNNNSQIWGSAGNWFSGESVQPGDVVRIRYDPNDGAIEERIPIYISIIERIGTWETEKEEMYPSSDVSDDKSGDLQTSRIECLANRIVRDAQLSRKIKELYNHACQLCGTVIEIGDGKKYSEIHHVKPLGSPHDGPDIEDNVICVCPDCHVRLDYGAIELCLGEITCVHPHSLGGEYVDYHNSNILQKTFTKD